MEFEDFLKTVAPKIGPKNAIDLSRDARLQAFERVLLEKTGVTKEHIDSIVAQELERLANNILKMPPPPLN